MFNKQRGQPLCKITKIMRKTNEKCYVKTQLKRVCNDKGESIEETLRRLTANKEPVPQNVPPIYTPLADGVLPDTDIRADRFDVAIAAQDKYAASKQARAAEIGTQEQSIEPPKNEE